MNKRYILKLYSRDSLRTMSKSKKKFYKLLLLALSTNLLTGNMLRPDSSEIISDLEKLLDETKPADNYDGIYNEYKRHLEKLLEIDNIFCLTNDNDYDDSISFTRQVLNDLIENNVAVYERSVVDKYINVTKQIKNIDDTVRLIGIHFETGIYPFSPEKLVWSDFKVLWNMFATYQKDNLNDWTYSVENNLQYERLNNKSSKEIQFITGTMERYVLVSCITYIECFLYNIRVMIKNNSKFKEKIKENDLQSVIYNDRVNDTQIIEDILFKIYPDLSELIKQDYQTYKKLLKLRDKYIHISIRENVKGKPEMNEIISSVGLSIEYKIKYIMNMVDKINTTIKQSDQINLLWWKKAEECCYEDLEIFDIV